LSARFWKPGLSAPERLASKGLRIALDERDNTSRMAA